MPRKVSCVALVCLLGSFALAPARPAQAQFDPGPNPVTGPVTTPQVLLSGTGSVEAGGSISTSGASLVPSINLHGSSTVINAGTIETTGTGSGAAISDSNNDLVLVIDNSGLIRSFAGDAVRVFGQRNSIRLTNSGTIRSECCQQAVDFLGVALAPSLLINTATGRILSGNHDAVHPGHGSVIQNAGLIEATYLGSRLNDGIDVGFTLRGVEVVNSGTISGRHAVNGGGYPDYTISIDNQAGGLLRGVNGAGVRSESYAVTAISTIDNRLGATIQGLASNLALDSNADGIDVDGVLVLDNAGSIRGFGAKGYLSGFPEAEGVAAGGGTIVNRASGEIIGSTLLADAPFGDPTRGGNGILVDDGFGGSAVTSMQIDNSGLIQGRSGFGVRIVGGFDDTLTNRAGGSIRGTGTPAVIRSGGGNDAITNSGLIQHDLGAGSTAIDAEEGDDRVTIAGGAASIVGDLDGGADADELVFDLGAGNAFSYGGSIRNFEQLRAVNDGHVTLTGALHGGDASVSGAARLQLDGTHTGGDEYRVESGMLLGSGSIELADAAARVHVEAAGVLAPGALDAAGRLSVVQGGVAIDGTLALDLDGLTAGAPGGYDQITLSDSNLGSVELGALSVLEVDLGFTPTLGDTFTLIDLGNDAAFVSGSFLGLPEAAALVIDGMFFRISYVGGTGNDVTLSMVPEPSTAALVLLPLLGLLRRRPLRGRGRSHPAC